LTIILVMRRGNAALRPSRHKYNAVLVQHPYTQWLAPTPPSTKKIIINGPLCLRFGGE
jgi:hypothetical protein